MPRPVRPWFRFYVETFNDRKILRLKPEQRWLWTAILGAARESPTPGELYVADGLPMTHAELARYADVPPRMVKPALEVMVALGMIAVEGELIRVPNFHARQYESDNVTARTRAHRERSKEQDGNVRRNVLRNTPETETETEKKDTRANALNSDFAAWYFTYPKKVGRPKALSSYKTARKKTDAETLLAGASAMAARFSGNTEFCPNPATWLNQERWNDDPPAADAEPMPVYLETEPEDPESLPW